MLERELRRRELPDGKLRRLAERACHKIPGMAGQPLSEAVYSLLSSRRPWGAL
jgi:hypothetical protein